MQILGIHSSPFKEGNTAFLLDLALEEAAGTAGVTTEACKTMRCVVQGDSSPSEGAIACVGPSPTPDPAGIWGVLA